MLNPSPHLNRRFFHFNRPSGSAAAFALGMLFLATACTRPPAPNPRPGVVFTATGNFRFTQSSPSLADQPIQSNEATLIVYERQTGDRSRPNVTGYAFELVTLPSPAAPEGSDGAAAQTPHSSQRLTIQGELSLGHNAVAGSPQFFSLLQNASPSQPSRIRLLREGDGGSKITAFAPLPPVERIFQVQSNPVLPIGLAAILRVQGEREFHYNLGYWYQGVRGRVQIRMVDSMRHQQGVFIGQLIPDESLGQSALDFRAPLSGSVAQVFGTECSGQSDIRLLLKLPRQAGAVDCNPSDEAQTSVFQFPIPLPRNRTGRLLINGQPSDELDNLGVATEVTTPLTLTDELQISLSTGQTVLGPNVTGRGVIRAGYRLSLTLDSDSVGIRGVSQLNARVTDRLRGAVNFNASNSQVEAHLQW